MNKEKGSYLIVLFRCRKNKLDLFSWFIINKLKIKSISADSLKTVEIKDISSVLDSR